MTTNTAKSERPSKRSEQVRQEAAKIMAPKVLKWIGDNDMDDADLATVENDLQEAMQYNDDGYDVARFLETFKYYFPDSELVGILDEAVGEILAVHRRFCIEWVKTSGMAPPAIGSKVTHSHGRGVGEIARNYEDGTSCVCFPDMGHDPNPGDVGVHGLVLPWEELTPVG